RGGVRAGRGEAPGPLVVDDRGVVATAGAPVALDEDVDQVRGGPGGPAGRRRSRRSRSGREQRLGERVERLARGMGREGEDRVGGAGGGECWGPLPGPVPPADRALPSPPPPR